MSTALLSAPAANDIRDIRGPIALPADAPIGVYVTAAVALLALALLAYLVWQRRPVRTPTPYELARQRLSGAETDLEREAVGPVVDKISLTVREYTETRFGVPAVRITTEDLLASCGDGPLGAFRQDLEFLLVTCDRARFQGCTLSRDVVHEVWQRANRFLEAAEASQHGVAR